MAWVAVDYIGEWIFNYKPDMWAGDCIEHNYWLPQDIRGAYGFQLPKGSIKKLIKRCINEMSSVLLDNLYGYWRGDLSDYLKDRSNLEYFMRGYKNDAYRYVMEWLDKNK